MQNWSEWSVSRCGGWNSCLWQRQRR